jgi:hypothetical protein
VYEGLKWCKKLNRWNSSFYHDEKYYFTGLYGSEHDASKSGNDKCKALGIPLKFELKKKQIGKKLSSSSNDTILLVPILQKNNIFFFILFCFFL